MIDRLCAYLRRLVEECGRCVCDIVELLGKAITA
jgi:hypothetical protein